MVFEGLLRHTVHAVKRLMDIGGRANISKPVGTRVDFSIG